MLRRTLLITVALWIVAVTAFGYWQMVYAWHLGSVMIFFSQHLPRFFLLLIAVVLLECFFLREKN
jgi:hypothetical protein